MKINKQCFFYKSIAVATFIIFGISTICWSQSTPLPSNHPVKVAAPHLPPILRHDGTGKPIYGDKYAYDRDRNITQLKNWIKLYPEEISDYKRAINDYLSHSDEEALSGNEKELYHDLKSQWLIFSQL
ncbi:hypothetical protein ACXYMU_00405 [Pontibacter sp. CAU 1760]